MAESCFIAIVPEAESRIGAMRQQYDESARLGMPAHITVLYPFMAPSHITAEVVHQCACALRTRNCFSFELSAVGRFSATTYLKPRPAEPFIALTDALWRAFPAYPPYRGEFATVVPHLTVTHGSAAAAESAATTIAADLEAAGPILAICSSVVLMENSSGRWRVMHAFPLA